MEQEVFELKGQEFIELNKLLKIMNWVPSVGEAIFFITNGMVKLNDEVITIKRKKLRNGDEVQFQTNSVVIR